MPPEICWTRVNISSPPPGPALAASIASALSIWRSITIHWNRAVATPPMAPATAPRQRKALMSFIAVASVAGEAEGVAAVVEELVERLPLAQRGSRSPAASGTSRAVRPRARASSTTGWRSVGFREGRVWCRTRRTCFPSSRGVSCATGLLALGSSLHPPSQAAVGPVAFGCHSSITVASTAPDSHRLPIIAGPTVPDAADRGRGDQ